MKLGHNQVWYNQLLDQIYLVELREISEHSLTRIPYLMTDNGTGCYGFAYQQIVNYKKNGWVYLGDLE